MDIPVLIGSVALLSNSVCGRDSRAVWLIGHHFPCSVVRCHVFSSLDLFVLKYTLYKYTRFVKLFFFTTFKALKYIYKCFTGAYFHHDIRPVPWEHCEINHSLMSHSSVYLRKRLSKSWACLHRSGSAAPKLFSKLSLVSKTSLFHNCLFWARRCIFIFHS